MMEDRYSYFVRDDYDIPTLIRLGSFASMEADMYVYPGVWENTPHLNDIRVGKGCFMDYDHITEEEAMKLLKKIQAWYDRIVRERKENTEESN